jgi:hypothetical protein
MKLQFKCWCLLISFCSGLTQTFACDCKGETTVENAIKYSSLVVVGTVISKDLVAVTDSHEIVSFSDENLKQSTFRYTTILSKNKILVLELYKGIISSDTLTVFTGTGGSDCGTEFTIGDKYIIYSSEKTYSKMKYNDLIYSLGKNVYWTDRCTRTSKYNQEEVQEIIKYEKLKSLTFKK